MKTIQTTILAALVAVGLQESASGFTLVRSQQAMRPHSTDTTDSWRTTPCFLFGGLQDAFKNDETLGKRENAGLKNGPKFNENVTVNGRPVKNAVVGQKIVAVASKGGVRIPVNCQQGDCGTCM